MQRSTLPVMYTFCWTTGASKSFEPRAAQAAFSQCVSAHLCLPDAADLHNILRICGIELYSMILCRACPRKRSCCWLA